MERIKTCLRYVTDISGPDLLSLLWLVGGSNSEKLKKIRYFNTSRVGGRIVLKIEVFVTYERVTRA